jgi:hypothetical protein
MAIDCKLVALPDRLLCKYCTRYCVSSLTGYRTIMCLCTACPSLEGVTQHKHCAYVLPAQGGLTHTITRYTIALHKIASNQKVHTKTEMQCSPLLPNTLFYEMVLISSCKLCVDLMNNFKNRVDNPELQGAMVRKPPPSILHIVLFCT